MTSMTHSTSQWTSASGGMTRMAPSDSPDGTLDQPDAMARARVQHAKPLPRMRTAMCGRAPRQPRLGGVHPEGDRERPGDSPATG